MKEKSIAQTKIIIIIIITTVEKAKATMEDKKKKEQKRRRRRKRREKAGKCFSEISAKGGPVKREKITHLNVWFG
jgi:hypothetical protein